MRNGLLITATVLMAACGAGQSDEVTVRDEAETVGAGIASDYKRQMNRARNVEIQLDDHKRDLDDAIEKQTNPDR